MDKLKTNRNESRRKRKLSLVGGSVNIENSKSKTKSNKEKFAKTKKLFDPKTQQAKNNTSQQPSNERPSRSAKDKAYANLKEMSLKSKLRNVKPGRSKIQHSKNNKISSPETSSVEHVKPSSEITVEPSSDEDQSIFQTKKKGKTSSKNTELAKVDAEIRPTKTGASRKSAKGNEEGNANKINFDKNEIKKNEFNLQEVKNCFVLITKMTAADLQSIKSAEIQKLDSFNQNDVTFNVNETQVVDFEATFVAEEQQGNTTFVVPTTTEESSLITDDESGKENETINTESRNIQKSPSTTKRVTRSINNRGQNMKQNRVSNTPDSRMDCNGGESSSKSTKSQQKSDENLKRERQRYENNNILREYRLQSHEIKKCMPILKPLEQKNDEQYLHEMQTINKGPDLLDVAHHTLIDQNNSGRSSKPAEYGFHLILSDDSTDEEGKPATNKPEPPRWSRTTFRRTIMHQQNFIQWQIIDKLFSVRPMTIDLKMIFPMIDSQCLTRNSSVIWSTPVRQLGLPKN